MSENKNENYMDGIIGVEDALNWFGEKEKFDRPYRKPINGTVSFKECGFTEDEKNDIKNWKRKNELSIEQYYDGVTDVESDSSPEAWNHYRKHYSPKCFKTDTNKDEYSFSFLGYSKPRLFSVREKDMLKKQKNYTTIKRGRPPKLPFNACDCERLGGDCDFNFGSAASKFGTLFVNTSTEYELLEKCKAMHHTLLNFSLIQGLGGLNNIKGSFLCLDNRDSEIQLDRLDRFCAFLNEFFLLKEKSKQEAKVNRGRGAINVTSTVNHLNTFRVNKNNSNANETTESLKNYCAKIYFLPTDKYYTGMMNDEKTQSKIKKYVEGKNATEKDEYITRWNKLLASNAKLIDALVESGKRTLFYPSASSNRVVEYMRLAVQFWKAKETYFELMDKVLDSAEQK